MDEITQRTEFTTLILASTIYDYNMNYTSYRNTYKESSQVHTHLGLWPWRKTCQLDETVFILYMYGFLVFVFYNVCSFKVE